MSVDEKPKKAGRPEYQPTEKHFEVVRALCLFGASHDSIAAFIGIAPKTLRKHYKELLKYCHGQKNLSVETSLFYNAVVKNNVTAQMYWLDNHMKDKYGKHNVDDPLEGIKDALLESLANKLPD